MSEAEKQQQTAAAGSQEESLKEKVDDEQQEEHEEDDEEECEEEAPPQPGLFGGRSQSKWESSEQILSKALEYKEKGNGFVAQKNWSQAALAYKSGRLFLKGYATEEKKKKAGGGTEPPSMAEQMQGKPKVSPEELQKVNDLNKIFHMNLALVQLNMGKPGAAVESANVALFHEPKNGKALFRRGCAYLAKLDWRAARSDFALVLGQQPTDAAALAKMEETKVMEQQEKGKEKKMFSKMFSE